jgi:hypothetical protein
VKTILGDDRHRVASLSKDRRRFKGVVASDRLKLFVGTYPKMRKLSNSQCLVVLEIIIKHFVTFRTIFIDDTFADDTFANDTLDFEGKSQCMNASD